MKKVLLVFPDSKGVFARIPLSVLIIAGYLEERGIGVEIFDAQVDNINEMNSKKYGIIGFSILFSSIQISSAIAIAKHFRADGAKGLYVWGGIHPTIMPEETIQNEYVDVVVRGEGEETLYQLIKAVSSSQNLEDVEGITFKRDGKIISTPDRDFIDMDSVPLFPYRLLKNPRKYSEITRKPRYFPIITSRGCLFSCGFCYVEGVHRRRWRPMSPKRVVKEIKHIVSFFSVNTLVSYDDNMFTSRKRMERIANLMIKEGLNIKWSGSIRFDTAVKLPKEFWELMILSGFFNPAFGGESGSTEILNIINKGISVEHMITTIRYLNEFDSITPYANFMFGIPGERYEDVLATFELIDMLGNENKRFRCGMSIYTPYPKTPLYNEALRHGFSPPRSLEEWGNYTYSEISNLPWVESGMLKSTLRTVSLFTHFRFNQPFMATLDVPRKNFVYVIAYILLSLSAKIRWKFKLFRLPIEWRLYEKILKFMQKAER